jgi:hypothetical protein
MEKKESTNKDNVETTAVKLLEKKKKELAIGKGSVLASKEVIRLHKEFLEKARGELRDLVSQGKINQEVAGFVSLWLGKTTKTLEDFADTMKSSYDIKTGEILMLDNVINNILKSPQEELKQPQEIKETPQQMTFATALQTGTTEDQPKKKRGRPDQVGKLGETVKRIKDSKLKKNQ